MSANIISAVQNLKMAQEQFEDFERHVYPRECCGWYRK